MQGREAISLSRSEFALLGILSLAALIAVGSVAFPIAGDFGWFLKSSGSFFVYLAAALLLLSVARKRGEEEWVLIALAMFVLCVATLIYFYDVQWEINGDPVELGSIVWLFMYPMLGFGVSKAIRLRERMLTRAALLESGIVAFSTFALGATIIAERLDDVSWSAHFFDVIVNLASVLADLAILGLLLAAAQRMKWNAGVRVWSFLVATMLLAAFDAEYTIEYLRGDYVTGSFIDLGWPASAVLLAVAALLPESPPDRLPPLGESSVVIPGIFTFGAALSLLLTADHPVHLIARFAAMSAIVMAALRMQHSVKTATGLAQTLAAGLADVLTGLPNRRALLALEQESVGDAALIVLELDGLGDARGVYDVSTGDEMLKVVVQRVLATIRSEDVLVRLGDDKFAVLLHDCNPRVATRIAETLVARIEEEALVLGHPIMLSASAGVAMHNGTGIERLLLQAAEALEEAQSLGTGLVRTFAMGSGERSQERLRIRTAIKETLRRSPHDFVPYFQPIVDLASGDLIAVEALVRWQRGDRVLGPAEFLNEVEQSGAMLSLTDHMLSTAMITLRDAHLNVPVTVNVSPDLVDGDLCNRVLDAIRGSGSTPEQLIVEVTEDVIVRDTALAAQVLGDLRALGVRIYLDDFGTGWSGLSSLRDFAMDGIKLDASFVGGMWDGGRNDTIVDGVASIAANLGLLVIYEGLEATDQIPALRARAKGAVQGYAVARPMPIESLVEWVRARRSDNAPTVGPR